MSPVSTKGGLILLILTCSHRCSAGPLLRRVSGPALRTSAGLTATRRAAVEKSGAEAGWDNSEARRKPGFLCPVVDCERNMRVLRIY